MGEKILKGYDYIVAIVGNPNSGKTTLFNLLTGANQRVGNWPGVTVEKKEGTFPCGDKRVNLVDLPGIYSVSATSEDERVARDYLLSGEADLVIDIVDASNLERNLYLTLQLIEMGLPVLLVLNMMDIAEESGIRIDLDHLSKHLQLPIVGVTGTNPESRDVILQQIIPLLENPPRSSFQVSYGNELEDAIARLQPALEPLGRKLHVTSRYATLKLIEGDPYLESLVLEEGLVDWKTLEKEKERIRLVLKDEADIVIAHARYGAIHGIVKDVTRKIRQKVSLTEKIDRIALHKVFGIPLFLFAMYLVFLLTMKVGGAFIDFFDIFFGAVFVEGGMAILQWAGAPPWVIAALAGGLGTGIQTVATFIPVIFTLFFALSILEDSGYMSRAAFVMDRFMKSIGLPGKAFVPLLVGFGCTVPAILGTRTLDNRRDRLMTIFMSPFMSCGARLPVYALFAAAFFSESAGVVVFSLYLIGILYAILTGLLLKATVFHGEPAHFIMELPPYHRPRLRHILIHTWLRLKIFLFRAGKVILGMVLVLGLLNSLGFGEKGIGFGYEHTEQSLLAQVGKKITPVFEPMGVRRENWPATVGLFTGILAKESVVGTLNSLYGQTQVVMDKEKKEFHLWGRIREAFESIITNLAAIGEAILDPIGWKTVEAAGDSAKQEKEGGADVFTRLRSSFSPVGAFAYLLFVLLYFPCVAAQGAAIRELGKRAGIALALYMTLLAWATAVLYYQVLEGGNWAWMSVALGIVFLIWVVFARFGKKLLSLQGD
ncbi:MAG: Fe(2+) transporter permease subunit FeoB [Spirochaetes bacterium]|nr:Fe(2+) transporter permease subunit FeoB [Spirochaetota bacterium]